ADPLGIERIGADEQRRQDLFDKGNRAGLGFAAPDTGDARLAKADPAGLVGEAHQHILAAGVFAQGADNGQVRQDVAHDRFGTDSGNRHVSRSEGTLRAAVAEPMYWCSLPPAIDNPPSVSGFRVRTRESLRLGPSRG